jgi:hypothetical protein
MIQPKLLNLAFAIVSLSLSFSSIQAQDVYEPNNLPDPNSIQEIELGQVYEISLHENSDIDWFKFTPNQGGVYKIKVLNVPLTPSSFDIDINVISLDEFNNQISVASDNSTPQNTGAQIEVLSCASSESYLFSINDGGFNQSSDNLMNLSIELDTGDECECNNTFATACDLEVGSTTTAKMWGINKIISNGEPYDIDQDLDFFAVEVEQSGVLEISVTDVPSNLPIRLEVYDSQENIVNVIQGNSGDDVSARTLVCDNNYFFRISSQNPYSPYEYRLSDSPFNISVELDTVDECECNNTFATACEIEVGSSTTAKMWGINKMISDGEPYDIDQDLDFFAVEVEQSGVLEISVTDVPTNIPIRLEVYDSEENVLNVVQGNSGDAINVRTIVCDDNYFFRISSQNPYSPYEYRLNNSPFNVSVDIDTTDGCECNNTIATACEIEVGSSTTAKMWGSNYLISDGTETDQNQDQDFFRLNIDSCGLLDISISDVYFDQSIRLAFYDDESNLLQSVQGDPGENINFEREVDEGSYYFRLTTQHPYSPYDYRLRDTLFTINTELYTGQIDLDVSDTLITANVEFLNDPITYQWYDCNTEEPIEGEESESFAPVSTGLYQLAVSNSTCDIFSDCIPINFLSTHTSSEISRIKVSPNPIHDIFKAESSVSIKFVRIRDIHGRICAEISLMKNGSGDISHLTRGMYVMEFWQDQNALIGSVKIIKD